MIIVINDNGGKDKFVPQRLVLQFYRVFRAELWKAGIQRDPKVGDCIEGIKIIAITM